MDADGAAAGGVPTKVTTTDTDAGAVRGRLRDWLADQVGDPSLRVEDLSRNTSSGMSSDSILFTAVREVEGRAVRSEQVLRVVPEASALPVFPKYDLREQASVMNAVAAHGLVPVPTVGWVEETGDVLGRPFLVMDRAQGSAPQDNPPYVFEGWVRDAGAAQLAQLQRRSIDVLVGIHATPEPEAILGLEPGASGRRRLGQNVREAWSFYQWTVDSGGVRIPLIERGFDWLKASTPRATTGNVLCWGDARIGNILYESMTPTAVLDWEVATVGPPELDVAWFILFHRIYQDLAEQYGKPGLPDFLRPADVIAEYEQASGRTLESMDFHLTLAAVKAAIIFARIKARTVHFGDTAEPETTDEYVLHHRMLNQIIDNEYEWGI